MHMSIHLCIYSYTHNIYKYTHRCVYIHIDTCMQVCLCKRGYIKCKETDNYTAREVGSETARQVHG